MEFSEVIEEGKNLVASEDYVGAREKFFQALRDDDPWGTFWMAALEERMGNYPLAWELLLRSPGGYMRACVLARVAKFHGDPDLAIRELEKNLDCERPSEIRFELARLLKFVGNHAKAWSVVMEANKLHPPKRLAAEQALAGKYDQSTQRTERPIFIMGMPRSGTTLLDRMLSTHPQVTSLGECQRLQEIASRIKGFPENLGDLEEAGKWYLDGTTGRTVDKNPMNFLLAGYIRGVFPNACFINMRRDWRDVLLSILFHDFEQGYEWGYHPRTIKHVIRAHDVIMGMFEDIAMQVPYEGLVQDPEFWLPRIQAHCGLDKDDGWVNYQKEATNGYHRYAYEQVRRPLHEDSIGLWKHYYDFAPDVFGVI